MKIFPVTGRNVLHYYVRRYTIGVTIWGVIDMDEQQQKDFLYSLYKSDYGQAHIETQLKILKELKIIKYCLIFFVILAIICIIIGCVAAYQIYNAIHSIISSLPSSSLF
jgi:hypothetical protein